MTKPASRVTLAPWRHVLARAERKGPARTRRAKSFAGARVLLLAISVLLVAIGLAGPALAQSRSANVVEMEAIISPITERYLELAQ